MERIQKIIAKSGYCSRRKAEDLIKAGKVTVDGKTAEIGQQADNTAKIVVNNSLIKQQNKVYFMLNKPKGLLVTMNDPQKRNTIYSLPSVKQIKERVFPVGRLDGMSQGLIILTNDGEFANKLIHPRYHVNKTYIARVEPKLKNEDRLRLEKGIIIDKRKTSPAIIKPLKNNEFQITIHEGRNRIIRKMVEQLEYKVYMLKRVRIGNYAMGKLKEGEIKPIEP